MSTLYSVRFPDGKTYGPAELAQLQQWAREGRLREDSTLIPDDGSPECSIAQIEALHSLVMAPPTVFTGLPTATDGDDAIATIIPYRNSSALIGYYTSIAALIPGVGLICGPLAIWLGIDGYRKSRKDPRAKGAVHAWIAIVLGGLSTLVYWGIVLLVAWGALVG